MSPTDGTVPTHRDGPLAFVDSLDRPQLTADDHHHLARVLRVADGAPMVVCDGAGRWRTARFAEAPEVTGDVIAVPAPAPPIGVAFALLKGDRPEWVTQKLTELGVDRIVPFGSDHCVVRWKGDRAARQVERLRRIAREAAMQCRRTWLPAVDEVTSFAELVAGEPAPVVADADGVPLVSILEDAPSGGAGTHPSLLPLVLIGPEGGWSDAERAAAPAVVRIADHVLRADTAALAAAALLTARRSGYC